MSRPRRPDMREALAPVFARHGDRGDIDRLKRVLLGGGLAYPADLASAVIRYLAKNPGASPRDVALALGRRREDIQRIVWALRGRPSVSRRAGDGSKSRERPRQRTLASADPSPVEGGDA